MAPPSTPSFLRVAPRLALLALLAACGDSLAAWGPDPATARRNADQAANGFSARFTNVQRDARFAAVRPLMGRYALAPSRLHRDSSLWTIPQSPDASRALYLSATLEPDGYRFRTRRDAPYPSTLGGERHYIRLRKLGDDTFEWITIVDHAIGQAPAATVGAALERFFTSFEGRDSRRLRAELAATLPRSSRQLGRLLRLDSLVSLPAPDGTTTLRLQASWQPDSLRRNFPAFASWVDRYVMPADFDISVADPAGVRYLHLSGTPGRLRVVARARGGRFVALTGPSRELPDTLVLRADASMKFKVFRVGFRDLVGSLIRERTERERTLYFRWQREPDWRFPLAVDQLIRSPLKTPFAGRGIEMRLAIRDDLGSQTMSLRHVRLVVHESAIMRWLGGLGATAFGDFEGKTEEEENRFLMEFFEALRRDLPGG